ncbi:MAG: VacJ family lipoprotein [Dokdonella sp.]
MRLSIRSNLPVHTRLPVQVLLIAAVLAGCSVAPPRSDDRFEPFNRKVYAFNDTLDKALIRPAAVVYRKVTTPDIRRLLSNFFANVRMPITIANDVLQAEPKLALRNTGRFAINTTLGFAGFFDPASEMKLPRNETDFGITLAKWGLPDGPYLVLPLIGSTSGRDVFRLPVDSYFFDPMSAYARNHDFAYHAQEYPSIVYLVTLRSSGIEAEGLLEGVYDPYVFYRDAYRQRRLYALYNGEPPREYIDKVQGVDEIDVDQLLEQQREYEEKQGDKSAKP